MGTECFTGEELEQIAYMLKAVAHPNRLRIICLLSRKEELNVSEIDLCVIIGNLLDNAMEACLRQTEEKERFIRVFIGVLKEQLYISVSNSVEGGIKKSDKTYFSGKGSEAHGFGLASIDRIAAKYDGYVNRQDEEGVFATEVLLPL